jgi:hypothetical protein
MVSLQVGECMHLCIELPIATCYAPISTILQIFVNAVHLASA